MSVLDLGVVTSNARPSQDAFVQIETQPIRTRLEPLPAKMLVGTEAFDRIRQNYEIKFAEVSRAGLLGVPIQVSPYLKPRQILFLDAEGKVTRTLEVEPAT